MNTVGRSAREADTEAPLGRSKGVGRPHPIGSAGAPYRYPTKDARSNKKLDRAVIILENRRLLSFAQHSAAARGCGGTRNREL